MLAKAYKYLTITNEALEYLAEIGYDPAMGGTPRKACYPAEDTQRTIQGNTCRQDSPQRQYCGGRV